MTVVKAAALRGMAVAVSGFACVWLFRLGYFLPIVQILGGFVAALIVVAKTPRRLAISAAVASYTVITLVLYLGLTNQVTNRTFDMTWRESGSTNPSGQTGLRLEFAEFPGNYVIVYGSALRQHLDQRGLNRVPVEFEVTSDLWCVRGYHEVRIDGRTPREVHWTGGGSGSDGSLSPWGSRHWWCGS